MDLRPWMGLLPVLLFLIGGYLKVRRERRSGRTTSFGHPILDAVLLLIAGLTLATTLGVALFAVSSNYPDWLGERLIAYPLVILVGGSLTWLCNRILRRRKKGEIHDAKED